MSIKIVGCSAEEINSLTAGELLSYDYLKAVNEITDPSERTRVRTLIILAAKEKGVEKEIKRIFKEYDDTRSKRDAEYRESLNHYTDLTFIEEQLYCGHWISNSDGVMTINRDGVAKVASRIPMVPIAILENKATGIEKVMIAFSKDGGKTMKTVITDRNTVASASKIVTLANKGLEVTSENAKLQVAYISDVITENIHNIKKYNAYSQLGWCDSGFVPYAPDAVFDGEENYRHLYHSVSEKGSYEAWKEMASAIRSNDCVRMMMAASFASVLISRVNALPFVFHLWGGTGTGKSVALIAAMSIWGNPGKGKLFRTMNMTQNSMLSTAALLNDLPFGGDELQTIKSRWSDYDQLIMQITEGINRGRMTYDKIEETKTWNCAFLFTGEEPCTHIGSGGGVKNRVIELEVTAPLFRTLSGNEVTTIAESNYGHAGRKFIEHISSLDEKELKRMFRLITDELMKTTGTTEKQASSMALILLADKLSCDCIFTDETNLRIEDVAKHLISADEVDVAERAYRWIFDHIAKNQHRFEIVDNRFGEVWGRKDTASDTILINATVLQNELATANFDFNAIKKKWADKGYLIKEGKHYAHNTTVGGFKARYVKLVVPPDEEKDDPIDYRDVPFT